MWSEKSYKKLEDKLIGLLIYSSWMTSLRCLGSSVGLRPESGESVAVVIGDHSGCTGLPSRGADLAVLIDVLEGLNKTDGLVNITANGKIVDGDLAEGTIR